MPNTGKFLPLLALAWDRPLELYDRLGTFVAVRLERLWLSPPAYNSVEWSVALEELTLQIAEPGEAERAGSELHEIEARVQRHLAAIAYDGPFATWHNADLTFARCCYMVARLRRPSTVVETGVAYGVTSAYILAALERNGFGRLVSVDLPPLARAAEEFVGVAVPTDLRGRWELHRGPSKRLLPALLAHVRQVDIFVHDSLHTYGNMSMELRSAWPRLPDGGVVLADDIEGNAAFADLTRWGPRFSRVVRESSKASLFGIAVK